MLTVDTRYKNNPNPTNVMFQFLFEGWSRDLRGVNIEMGSSKAVAKFLKSFPIVITGEGLETRSVRLREAGTRSGLRDSGQMKMTYNIVAKIRPMLP